MPDRGDCDDHGTAHEGARVAHGFFFDRERIDFGVRFAGNNPHGLKTYANIPAAIGAVISSGLATLAELDSVYGVKDLYDLLEVVMVDAFNRSVLEESARGR